MGQCVLKYYHKYSREHSIISGNQGRCCGGEGYNNISTVGSTEQVVTGRGFVHTNDVIGGLFGTCSKRGISAF